MRELHLFVSGQYLITIHRQPLPPLEDPREQLDGQVLHSEQFLLYRVLDALTDSFFPILAGTDDEIDDLEAAVLEDPSEEQLERLFSLKRQLIAMRRVVTPQRDLFARSVDQIAELPGFELDERDYFRDVYDHLIRISDLIDSYRDLLSGRGGRDGSDEPRARDYSLVAVATWRGVGCRGIVGGQEEEETVEARRSQVPVRRGSPRRGRAVDRRRSGRGVG
ncbi:MAG: hypothetical protein JO046_10250 [Solirubrobacterales bacterium]|nr:hypothetical protein [Solirubrobacterales bacterium]